MDGVGAQSKTISECAKNSLTSFICASEKMSTCLYSEIMATPPLEPYSISIVLVVFYSEMLMFPTGVLYFVSCTVNPILYNLMSRRYRQAFRETICVCDRFRCPLSPNSPPPPTLASPSIAYLAANRSTAAVTHLMVKSATTSTF